MSYSSLTSLETKQDEDNEKSLKELPEKKGLPNWVVIYIFINKEAKQKHFERNKLNMSLLEEL